MPLTQIIKDQTVILLHNVHTAILTCDLDYYLCDIPIWKHIYHMLYSCDKWFINPERYTAEPDFHEPGLNSLNECGGTPLSRETLLNYFEHIRRKTLDYLSNLNDDQLPQNPDGCKHSRMALILGQFRHLYAHMGNINAVTIIETGNWPRVTGLDGNLSDSLFE
ncbi:MAG: DinB family protein [Oscillospiraceae bacterium]|nr:DinB family protein [Oscillospiraceae bacterium]